MARPWRHPKTGVYWFRKAVPVALRPILGKREIKISLRTKNPAEAQVQHAIAAVDCARLFMTESKVHLALTGIELNLPKLEQKLDHIDYYALAGELYRKKVSDQERNPEFVGDYEQSIITEGEWQARFDQLEPQEVLRQRRFFAEEAKEFLRNRGYFLDDQPAKLVKFLKAYAYACKLSSEQLLKNAEGDYSEHPEAKKFPALKPKRNGSEVDLWVMWEKYSPRLKPSSRKRWRTVMKTVEARFGLDLATLNFDELIKWRDELLETLSPKTVSEVYFASLRWLLNRCVNERKLLSNVAAGIEIEARREPKVREREFTAAEAKKILAATLCPSSKPMTVENAAVRRWVPWLLAYSGARLNEITQLRYQDIHCVENLDARDEPIWLMKITPEAGTVKTSSFRDVPLHPHLVHQGFLKYVMTRTGLPLFYDPKRARKRSDENPYFRKVGDRLTEWIRSIGIDDENVQPNHAWRHLFKSTGRFAMIPADVLDALQGHKPANEGANYGQYWPKLSYDYIKRIPRFEVEGLPAMPPKEVAESRLEASPLNPSFKHNSQEPQTTIHTESAALDAFPIQDVDMRFNF